MELWDIYDENRQKTGRTMVRGEKMPPGEFHLVIHVCLFNSKGEMLIQKRTMQKESFPGLWDLSVGGSAVAGDTGRKAASRELEEELGVKIDFSGIRPYATMHFKTGFDDVFLVEKDLALSDLTLQKEEVSEAKWASLDTILEMIDNGDFISYYKDYIRLLFAAPRVKL